MRIATVSKLKMSLSAYLRQVKEGEEVIITEHGRPIARLLPLTTPESVTEHLKSMETQGLLTRGGKPLSADFWDLPRPLDPQAAVRSAAIQEREEGW